MATGVAVSTYTAPVPITPAVSVPMATLIGEGRRDEAIGGIDRGERGSGEAQGHDAQPGGD
jgi:hypothetical protein